MFRPIQRSSSGSTIASYKWSICRSQWPRGLRPGPTVIYIFFWRCGPTRPMASSFLWLLDHTQRRTTTGRTALDEWSARRWDLYLTTHNAHKRQTSVPPTRFETTISAGKRPHTYAPMIYTRKIFTSNTIWSVTCWSRRQNLPDIHFEYYQNFISLSKILGKTGHQFNLHLGVKSKIPASISFIQLI